MNHRSIVLRLLAVFLTAGLVLTTGLVAASALSASVEDPTVVSVDENPETDGGSDEGRDGEEADDEADEADDKADDAADDGPDDADSGDDADEIGDEIAPVGETGGNNDDNHGATISELARNTPPGPGHGFVVCTAASGGNCRPDDQTEDADTSDVVDEEQPGGPPEGRGRADAARAGRPPRP